MDAKKLSQLYLNHRGDAMIQVLIAFAVLGALAVYMMQANKTTQNIQKGAASDLVVLDQIKKINKILTSNRESCEANLLSLPFSSGDQLLTQLKLHATQTNPTIELNKYIEGTSLKVKEIKAIPPSLGDLDSYGFGMIKIKLTLTQDSGYGAKEFSENFEVKARFCKTQDYQTVAGVTKREDAENLIEAACKLDYAVTGDVYIEDETLKHLGLGVWEGICLYDCGADSNYEMYGCPF